LNYRNLGRSGLRVSLVGLGCNNFGSRMSFEAARATVEKGIDLGVNFFDTADGYGPDGLSEEYLGRILGSRRKDVLLATKFGLAVDGSGQAASTSRRYIMSAAEASLRRLKTDWIDLYQIHRFDARTPIEETLRALDDLIHQGKVRYAGCSTFPAWRITEAHWTGRQCNLGPMVSSQEQYSLLARGIESDVIPAAEAAGLGLLPFLPLAGGMLTGKYRPGGTLPEGARLAKYKSWSDRFFTDQNWAIVASLDKFCAERGHTLLELAFSWLARHPIVSSIIAGATSAEQLQANVNAADWSLTDEDMTAIDRLTTKPQKPG
jgi:aryl-alcohol dehydrogenase-like predicted oxidoreductase